MKRGILIKFVRKLGKSRGILDGSGTIKPKISFQKIQKMLTLQFIKVNLAATFELESLQQCCEVHKDYTRNINFQIKPSRPMQRTSMSKRLKTVTRSYGGSRCHTCVRNR